MMKMLMTMLMTHFISLTFTLYQFIHVLITVHEQYYQVGVKDQGLLSVFVLIMIF